MKKKILLISVTILIIMMALTFVLSACKKAGVEPIEQFSISIALPTNANNNSFSAKFNADILKENKIKFSDIDVNVKKQLGQIYEGKNGVNYKKTTLTNKNVKYKAIKLSDAIDATFKNYKKSKDNKTDIGKLLYENVSKGKISNIIVVDREGKAYDIKVTDINKLYFAYANNTNPKLISPDNKMLSLVDITKKEANVIDNIIRVHINTNIKNVANKFELISLANNKNSINVSYETLKNRLVGSNGAFVLKNNQTKIKQLIRVEKGAGEGGSDKYVYSDKTLKAESSLSFANIIDLYNAHEYFKMADGNAYVKMIKADIEFVNADGKSSEINDIDLTQVFVEFILCPGNQTMSLNIVTFDGTAETFRKTKVTNIKIKQNA